MEEYIDNEPTDNTAEPKNPLSGKSTKYPMERVVSVLESYREHKGISKKEFSEMLETFTAYYKLMVEKHKRNMEEFLNRLSESDVYNATQHSYDSCSIDMDEIVKQNTTESYENFLHKFNIHKQEAFSEDEIEYANYKTLYDEALRNQADLTDLPSPETVEILKNKGLDVTELYKK